MTSTRRRAFPASEDDVREPGPGGQEPRTRVRPPRLSRQRVVDAALRMLQREPNEPPTITRIAREVETVPAALYRHFESIDDILDCVLTRILEASPADLEEGATWQVQLSHWMQDLRRHLLQYPAILAMIDHSGRTAPAWLDASSALVEILKQAGLSGRDLALGYLWILETTVGVVRQEAALPLPHRIASACASAPLLSDTGRTRFAAIADALGQLDGEAFFGFVVAQTTAAVESRIRSGGFD